MASKKQVVEYLRSQISDGHQRLGELMDDRLTEVGEAELERYFAILSRLLSKLEEREKTLKQVAREMVAETAATIMSELAD